MSGIGKYKLTDALPRSEPEGENRGKTKPAVAKPDAEQIREANESAGAKDAEASPRARMVDIGRGNQQAGRQGS